MTKCELKKEIEKIRDKVGKMKALENATDWAIYIALDQKGCLLGHIIPKVLEYIEIEDLFTAYKMVTAYILRDIIPICKFTSILKEIQLLLDTEIKRHEKQIKVLRTKLNVSNMKVLNPRKDLEQETLYYISVDKTQVSHNEYKLLKELGRDE